MLNRREITAILVITIILAFTLSLIESWQIFLYTGLSVLLIILINVFAKKIAAYYLDSEIRIKIWGVKQFGFRKHWHLRDAFPFGALFPIITTVISYGYFNWMAGLVFDVEPKIYKAAKRHGLYSFSEMTEYHLAIIAATGIFANLLFAIIGYLIGFPEFARLNIYFAFFNLFPFSNLDGNKIFFGSLTLWSFLAAIVLIIVAGLILIA